MHSERRKTQLRAARGWFTLAARTHARIRPRRLDGPAAGGGGAAAAGGGGVTAVAGGGGSR
jgi:hypothetical protein